MNCGESFPHALSLTCQPQAGDYPTFLHVPLEYLHASSSRQSPGLVRQVLSQLLKATHLSSVCTVLEQHFIPMLEGCSEMLGGHHLQL